MPDVVITARFVKHHPYFSKPGCGKRLSLQRTGLIAKGIE
ncbi:hypothetical protein ENTCAN_05825 [Enterobacter cancerogenus ATCC 35316]|nr:hypothetical protein ENTCAN_05825 [Enterobacter cancerogenus ATCC 35316]